VHPLRTTILLVIAQIVGAPQAPTPTPTSTPTLTPTATRTHSLPTSLRWAVAVSASPAAPPVIDGDLIFIVLQSGVVSARKISDGTPAWEASLRSDRAVAVDGGRVFVATSEQIVALNAADGANVWTVDTPALTAPLIAHGDWVIAESDNALTAFRSADGSQVWQRDLLGTDVKPTIEGDNLYVPLQNGRLLALDLRTGAERWGKNFVGPLSEVLALPDRIFFGTDDKWFFCLRASDGAREWQRVRLGSIVRGRPIADENHIYVASMDNTLRAFRRENGALLWHPTVPFRPTTGPVLIESAVVIAGNAAELRAFDAVNGRAAGEIKLEEPLVMPPAFGKTADGVLMSAFTGTLNGQWKLVLSAPPAPAPEAPHE
jgi:outer membrane protein assembly factor BamB